MLSIGALEMANIEQDIAGRAVIRHIFISPGHNFRGHHSVEPGEHPMLELDSVECVAGFFGFAEAAGWARVGA